MLGQVHVKSRQSRLWRSLLVARRTLLDGRQAIENVVRAVLREAGLKLGRPSCARLRGSACASSLLVLAFAGTLVWLRLRGFS